MAFTEPSPLECYWLIHQMQAHPRLQEATQELIANPLVLTLLTTSR
ncbi:hypothetical protein [Hymenobacter sediminis]|nr:hypothetical protein [Hymenobacter sediminis]